MLKTLCGTSLNHLHLSIPHWKKNLHTTGSDIQQTCRASDNYVLCWAVQLGVPAPWCFALYWSVVVSLPTANAGKWLLLFFLSVCVSIHYTCQCVVQALKTEEKLTHKPVCIFLKRCLIWSETWIWQGINTGHFIMFYMITNICNK